MKNKLLEYEAVDLQELELIRGGGSYNGCLVTNGKCSAGGGCGITNGKCPPPPEDDPVNPPISKGFSGTTGNCTQV